MSFFSVLLKTRDTVLQVGGAERVKRVGDKQKNRGPNQTHGRHKQIDSKQPKRLKLN